MSEADRSRYFLLALTVASYAVIFPIAWISGMRIDYGSFIRPLCFALAFLLVLGSLCRWRGIATLYAAVESCSAGILLTMSCTLAVYLAMRADMPLVDDSLVAIDRSLGLNWSSLIHFVDAKPLLANILVFAYGSFTLQLLSLPMVLALWGRSSRSYRFVSAYAAIILVSCLISIYLPAIGNVATHPLDISALKNLNPHLLTDFLPQLVGVRENPDFVFRLPECRGIMTFPSVHAAVAVLCAWAAWDIRWIRYPVLVLNLLMIISAVTIGTHYVIDIVAGCVVSAFCIWLVHLATRAPLRSLPSLIESAHLPVVR